jgi:hypothetical protein
MTLRVRVFVSAIFALVFAFCAAGEDGWRLRMMDRSGVDDPNNVGVGRLAAPAGSLSAAIDRIVRPF